MNLLKPLAIASTVILSFMLLLLTAYLFTKKHKSRLDEDGKLKRSYALWYAAIFLAGTKVIAQVLDISVEISDIVIKTRPNGLILTLTKAIALVVGSAFMWFVLCVFATQVLIPFVSFKTSESEEMADDHLGYFVIKSAMLIGVVFCSAAVVSLFLKTFVPAIQIPYYH